jgi:heterodisulfide reductase subunit B2
MSYAYYPGCSAKGTGRAYEESLHAVLGALGTGLDELGDWNCCGASGYPAVDAVKATALSARNLALAEGTRPGPVDVIAPCAGCYRALLKTERTLADDGTVAARVGRALGAAGLQYEGRARARHPLDVLVNDIGLDRIAEAAVRPLRGLRVACYYGCLLVRPYATFDDRRAPTSMERLLEAVGAEPIDWPLRTRCCGGSCYCGGPLIGALPEATLRLSYRLLKDAKRRGADAIATVCPLCQFNLEAFQGQMARKFGEPADLTIGFFAQLDR